LDERETSRLCCFICQVPFTTPKRRRGEGRAGLREVWADGERVIMICGTCVESSQDPSSTMPDFDIPM
jgi:hypothetical protein